MRVLSVVVILMLEATSAVVGAPPPPVVGAYAPIRALPPKVVDEPNVFSNLRALKDVEPQEQGAWHEFQICEGNGRCHTELRWVPAQPRAVVVSADGINDALDELNAQRAQRGLRAYIRDANLTRGAQAAANARAAALLFEHTANDFAYLPAGTTASAAGCAAYPASYGFMACEVYSTQYTYAGAAYAMGRDGKRYCHLFVR